MWNGCDMIWNHISTLYYADLNQDLHQLPKLKPDHINFTSFIKMEFILAAQVLSNTMALALQRFYPEEEAKETARFCKMINTFFDCLNVRSTTERILKRNDSLAPHSNPDDQGRSQGGGGAIRSFDNPFLKMFKSGENVDWEGGCEVKGDHTSRKLWIDHLYKAGNCSLEALEFSIFLGCYLPMGLLYVVYGPLFLEWWIGGIDQYLYFSNLPEVH